jgi:hypothetical protein
MSKSGATRETSVSLVSVMLADSEPVSSSLRRRFRVELLFGWLLVMVGGEASGLPRWPVEPLRGVVTDRRPVLLTRVSASR